MPARWPSRAPQLPFAHQPTRAGGKPVKPLLSSCSAKRRCFPAASEDRRSLGCHATPPNHTQPFPCPQTALGHLALLTCPASHPFHSSKYLGTTPCASLAPMGHINSAFAFFYSLGGRAHLSARVGPLCIARTPQKPSRLPSPPGFSLPSSLSEMRRAQHRAPPGAGGELRALSAHLIPAPPAHRLCVTPPRRLCQRNRR